MSVTPRVAPARRVRLPANIEMEDRVAFSLTARQLVILAAAAILSYLLFTAAGSVLPVPVAAACALPVGLAGVALALGRLDGLSGDRIAVAVARHLMRSPRLVAADGLPARLAGAPVQPGVSLLRAPVGAILASGLVELADGSSVLLLAATGTSFALRSAEEQAALSDAYGRWLNSLTEPVTITVRSVRVDLSRQAETIRRIAGERVHPALAQCARAHARFLGELAREGEGLRRRQILIVIGTRARSRDVAEAQLQQRAEETAGLLAPAGVQVQTLDGQHAAGVLFGALEPPGPPAGSRLDGVVSAC